MITDEKTQAARYRLEQQCSNYASVFLKRLRAADTHTAHIRHIMPIMFEDASNGQDPSGRVDYNGDQACIYFKLPVEIENMSFSERLQRLIRHEVIHFYLWRHYPGYDGDNSPLFWALCHIFDAGAYKEIGNEHDKKAYNRFLSRYSEKKSNSENLSWAFRCCVLPKSNQKRAHAARTKPGSSKF